MARLLKGVTEVVLHAPDGTGIFSTFKLEFFCSNNEDEYEALIIGSSLPYK